jgi:hypothetical protein
MALWYVLTRTNRLVVFLYMAAVSAVLENQLPQRVRPPMFTPRFSYL